MNGRRIVDVLVGSVMCWALGAVYVSNMAFAGSPSFANHQETLQTHHLDFSKLRTSSSQQSSPSRHPPLSPREISDIVNQTQALIHQAEALHARGKYYRFNRGRMFELFSQLEDAKERQLHHDFIQAALLANGVVQELTEAVAEREREEEKKAKAAIVALLAELDVLQKSGTELEVIKALEKRIEAQEKPLREKAFLEVQEEAQDLEKMLSEVKHIQATIDRVQQEVSTLKELGLSGAALLPAQQYLREGQQDLREGQYQDAIAHIGQSSETMRELSGLWKTLTAIRKRIETIKSRSDQALDLARAHTLFQLTNEALHNGKQLEAKTQLVELQGFFTQHQLATVGSGTVVLIDEKFVDYEPGDGSAEASNLVAALTQLEHPFTTITQVDGDAFVSATSENSIFILPSLDQESLIKHLDENSRQALGNFVENGGTLLAFYPNENLFDLLESLFGWHLEFGEETPPFRLNLEVGPDPVTQEAPVEITFNYHLDTVAASSLPSNGKILYYTAKGDGVITFIPHGAGAIWIFSWDWMNSVPTGTQDGGWLKVLKLALTGDLSF